MPWLYVKKPTHPTPPLASLNLYPRKQWQDDFGSWEKFNRVIKKSMMACLKSGQVVENHFSQVDKLVQIGSGAKRKLKEEEKRLFLRNEMREHNKQLVETAQKSGVESRLDFAIFQNHGNKGLYGGLDAKAIHRQKGGSLCRFCCHW